MNAAYPGMALLAALAAVSFGALSPWQEEDPVVVSSIGARAHPQDRFQLHSGGHDAGCHVAAEDAGGAKRRLVLDAACVDLNPDLAGAHWWLERPDGSVAFARLDGNVIAEFAVADGAVYESYRPAEPIMTLLAGD